MENIAEEHWRDVVGYEGLYKVSSFGRVMSLPRRNISGKILKPVKSNTRYLQVSLSDKDRNRRTRNIHRLVAEAFLKPDPSRLFVNHINNQRDDNNLCNLEWVTPSENCQHAKQFGRYAGMSGADHPRSVAFLVTFPDGIVKIYRGISCFCRKYNISVGGVVKCLNGEIKEYKGFRFNREIEDNGI